ncbi:MAG: TetR family transcriptional regulator [Acidobacteria bacterium]|jgi:AcrR family transcriptional regulator|nr:TetR family transcriptional regulator [Acidobacteriota bacterium]
MKSTAKSTARDSIREAAIGLFAEKGYAATTTREICRRAGVTKPVLYYHFESKERLYSELALDASNESRKQLLLASQREGSVRERLVAMMAASFALTMREPKLSTMFLRMVFPAGEAEPGIDCVGLGLEYVSLIAGVVSEGIRRGELQGRAQEVAQVLTGVHLIWAMSYVLTGGPKLDRNLARRMVDLVVDGCGNPSGRAGKRI